MKFNLITVSAAVLFLFGSTGVAFSLPFPLDRVLSWYEKHESLGFDKPSHNDQNTVSRVNQRRNSPIPSGFEASSQANPPFRLSNTSRWPNQSGDGQTNTAFGPGNPSGWQNQSGGGQAHTPPGRNHAGRSGNRSGDGQASTAFGPGNTGRWGNHSGDGQVNTAFGPGNSNRRGNHSGGGWEYQPVSNWGKQLDREWKNLPAGDQARNGLGGQYGSAPAPVPEPATMLLFGTGLVGLAGARYRRKIK